jgi:hypothetical protein
MNLSKPLLRIGFVACSQISEACCERAISVRTKVLTHLVQFGSHVQRNRRYRDFWDLCQQAVRVDA